MNRGIGQRISLVFAALCVVAAIAAAIAAVVYEPRAALDPIHASLMASAFFFGCCAVVLYVIGTAHLRGDVRQDGD